MDQESLAVTEVDAVFELVDRLGRAGIEIHFAFWVREADSDLWFLYLASPFVDREGTSAAYGIILPEVKSAPELGIDRSRIKAVGLKDSMTQAVRKLLTPKIPDSPFAVRPDRPYPGMTRYGGTTLGGLEISGGYLYPPFVRFDAAQTTP